MEDTRITLRDTRNNDRSSDRAQQLGRFFLPLSFPFFDPPLEEDRSKEVAPDRISVSRTRTRRMHAIFPFLRATHTYVPRRSREDGRRERVGIGKGQVRRGSKFGVNWGRGKKRGSESGGGTVSGRWQFYGNADICITRAPTRYRRVCKPAFLHLMYTFHVAANCTGRRKDSRASARRYYVTCRSIMIPPLR